MTRHRVDAASQTGLRYIRYMGAKTPAVLTHSGALHGATLLGEACAGGQRSVRIGLWIEGRRIWRARFQATPCAVLPDCAELACQLLETGEPLASLDGARLRRDLRGIRPLLLDSADRDSAELVAQALRSAGDSWPFEEACNQHQLNVLHKSGRDRWR